MSVKKRVKQLYKYEGQVTNLSQKHNFNIFVTLLTLCRELKKIPDEIWCRLDLKQTNQATWLWSLIETALDAKKSCRDALTGLANRTGFNSAFVRFIHLVKRSRNTHHTESEKYLYLMFIDADHFKSINDKFGHAVGDKVLQKIAEVLSTHTRACDFCARWGGEELALLVLSGSDNPKNILEIAERIRGDVKNINLNELGVYTNTLQEVTVSIGISRFISSSETLIEEADQALYKAKSDGRDCVVFYENDKD